MGLLSRDANECQPAVRVRVGHLAARRRNLGAGHFHLGVRSVNLTAGLPRFGEDNSRARGIAHRRRRAVSLLPPGSVLADFKVEDVVGRGGMGVVYQAVQVSLGRPVALKLIAPHLAGEEGFRERFAKESRLCASLDHPHIVPVYGAGEADGIPYIAMRFVHGMDLRAAIASSGHLAPARAVRPMRWT